MSTEALTDCVSQGLRVAVALSGGVDSAVVAALIKEQGADVFALTMRLQPDDDVQDAQRISEALGIPHEIVDLTALFHASVMEAFAESYAMAETPSPCVRCNRLIKFGALMEVARQRGAHILVTGHYVRRVETPVGAQIHVGADRVRDQSYFLCALSQQQIDFMRAPLGAMSKDETRALAAHYHLPVAQKKDSQDICFVPCGDYTSVLNRLRPEAFLGGKIVDETGRVLGQHDGIAHFTVGQRKGLNLGNRMGDHNEPLFVLGIDAESARVIVGPRAALSKSLVYLDDVNWLAERVLPSGMDVEVKLRSSMQPASATFYMNETHNGRAARIVLKEPAFGVAKGQAAALYVGSRLLGGGWIVGAE